MAYPGALFRYGTFSLGVVVASFGSSLIVKAGLGCSPIASLPFVINLLVPAVTLGTFTFLINAAALAGQAAVLRREFRPAQLLQLPASFLFSMGLDVWLWLLRGWTLSSCPARTALLLAGCTVLGLGVALEVMGDVMYLPCEGFCRAVNKKYAVPFGAAKTAFDVTIVAAAIAVSLLCLGRLAGAGAGTVVAAVSTGGLAQLFQRLLRPLLGGGAPLSQEESSR